MEKKGPLGGFRVTLSGLLLRWLFNIFTWDLKVNIHGELADDIKIMWVRGSPGASVVGGAWV